MTIKDSFQTEGCITTSGAPDCAQHLPDADAWPVARLRAAGAIPFAKTNLPIFAGDIQSFNDVYGTTNNPHDLDRTCGRVVGWFGGGALDGLHADRARLRHRRLDPRPRPLLRGDGPQAELRASSPASGRSPAHPARFAEADLAVTGPMARSIGDLELELDVLAGPDRWNAPAWRLELPPARGDTLAGLRIAAWLDDDHCPVDASTRRVLAETVAAIESAGGRVDTEARPGFTLEKVDTVFKRLLFAALSSEHSREKVEHMAGNTDDSPLGFVKRPTAARHRDWLSDNERRMQIRERWRLFFEQYDVILMPVQPRGAIPHDHSSPQWGRTVEIDGVERPYLDLFSWTGPAGAGMLPATVVPAGIGDDGLPIGVQIVGPYLHDRTTLQAGRLIARLRGGCPRPALAR